MARAMTMRLSVAKARRSRAASSPEKLTCCTTSFTLHSNSIFWIKKKERKKERRKEGRKERKDEGGKREKNHNGFLEPTLS